MKFIKSALITTLLLIGGSANAAFINFSDYTATAYGNQSKTLPEFKCRIMAGRPKGEKSFTAMLRIAIKEAGKVEGTTKLRDIADQLVTKAVNGDIQAIKEVADRLDGKPAQAIVGDQDNPLEMVHRIERHIIGPNAKD